MNKRDFLKLTGVAAGTAMIGSACAGTKSPTSSALARLKPMTEGVEGISVRERKARVAKAQRLMAEAGLDAIVIEPGSSMLYFSGIRWRRSERLTALVIPREGGIAVVTPYFEEPSVRESMSFGDEVRTWHEHESPFALVAGILKDRGLEGEKVGLEATVRFFVLEGLRDALRSELRGASEVVDGCRMYKSEHELALMKKANEITLRAYAHVHQSLAVGMSSAEIKAEMSAAQRALGGRGAWSMALLGEASAYPHGSKQEVSLTSGEIVLMDCGCSVEGYQSDISRTFVLGAPTARQREVWKTVRRGQEIVFESARLGASGGSVDDAVRRYYESLGYGPDYKTPGLSHRTGHGIGMDGHERANFVRGERTLLAPGMCFSNEPGLYDFASFGVRLEDCLYMTETGPAWFTVPPESLESPVGTLG